MIFKLGHSVRIGRFRLSFRQYSLDKAKDQRLSPVISRVGAYWRRNG